MGKARRNQWLRAHAQAQRAKAKQSGETEKQVNERQAKEFLTRLVKEAMEQKARLERLAPAFAERCWRVHELMGQLRAEWERAEAAEARIEELEREVEALAKPKSNGHSTATGKPPRRSSPRRAVT